MILVVVGGIALGVCSWAPWLLAYWVFWLLAYRHADRRAREGEQVWAAHQQAASRWRS